MGLWDVQKGVLVSWLQGHTSTVTACTFLQGGGVLVRWEGRREGGRGCCNSLGEEGGKRGEIYLLSLQCEEPS